MLLPQAGTRTLAAIALMILLPLPVPLAFGEAAPVAVTESREQPIIREEGVTGTLTSLHAANLSTQVAGLVTTLSVDAGDRVEPGDLLVELDAELAEHGLAAANAEAERAGAELAEARRLLREGQRLVKDNSIAESELEARAAAAEIAAAEQAIAAAELLHQQARVARHRIEAPFAGVISRRHADLGEWVSPGTTVMELVATEDLRFDFRVPQELYPLVAADTRVELRLTALPDTAFAGEIQAIVPVNDPTARTFLLRVLPADGATHPAMTPGMSVQGTLYLDSGRTNVTVPRDALLRHPDGRVSLWVLERSGEATQVQERQVTLGLMFGDRVEIRDGLAAGVPVVVEGNEALEPGQAVRVLDKDSQHGPNADRDEAPDNGQARGPGAGRRQSQDAGRDAERVVGTDDARDPDLDSERDHRPDLA
ncbi:efflux RND transporter periplasmic adaptor subunit [Halochromatium sp.]